MKKCFTINQMRTREEFLSYHKLFDENLYQAVEIFYPYNQSTAQLEQYMHSVAELQTKYPHLEMVLHLPHGLYNGLCLEEHLNSGSFEVMVAAARFAATFKIKKLTLHLGLIDTNIDRNVYVEKIIPLLQKLCDIVKTNNQVIMIENMPTNRELGYSPDELLTIIKGVNRSNLKFIYDTGHAHVSEYDDISYLYTLKDYLYHIHYSDNDGSRDAHKELGTGTIDFKCILTTLNEIKYQELHCMEIIYHTVEDLIKNVNDFEQIGGKNEK